VLLDEVLAPGRPGPDAERLRTERLKAEQTKAERLDHHRLVPPPPLETRRLLTRRLVAHLLETELVNAKGPPMARPWSGPSAPLAEEHSDDDLYSAKW
jgi:hypothetical protein